MAKTNSSTATRRKKSRSAASDRNRPTAQNRTAASVVSRKRPSTPTANLELEVKKRGKRIWSVTIVLGDVKHHDETNLLRTKERARIIRDFARKLERKASELHQLDDLLAEAAKEAERLASEVPDEPMAVYRRTEGGLILDKSSNEGVIPVQLTNFDAEIVEDIREDDSYEVRRTFRIQAVLHGNTEVFTFPASKFASMNWPTEYLGASAIVSPGFGAKDHARAAIQTLSTNIVHRTVFKHIGWRQVNNEMVFLHGAGAIGPKGPVEGVEVILTGDLSRYVLPDIPRREELQECIRQSLRLRELAPLPVTCSLEGAVFRAALGGDCDSTLWLTGETGGGKSELTARYQQFYGSEMDRKRLPGTWLSTGNALEASASTAKDALFVIDDFCPTGTMHDVARYNQLADRVIRAARNKSGRQRMSADCTLRPTRVPRCIIVGTGEDIPSGHSLRSSMMIVELSPGDLKWDLLTDCQQLGTDGVFAKTMAGYVRYVAKNYEKLRDDIRQRLALYRERASSSASHRRTPDLVANLATGCWFFLRYALAVRAIDRDERNRLFQEAWSAIGEAAQYQVQHQRTARPELRFLQLICSALGSEAHLADIQGQRPRPNEQAVAYGWRRNDSTSLGQDRWTPMGKRIGWIEGDDIYLDPDASYKAAQNMANQSERIPVAEKTLHKRLHDAGLLASVEEVRGRLTVRRILEGTRRSVLHLKSEVLCQE